MSDEIRVHVFNKGRASLYLRYIDPITGKAVTKSAQTSNMTEARKAAGKWESELQTGQYKPASKVTWNEFRDSFEVELETMSDSYASVMSATFNHFEKLGVEKLSRINTQIVDRFIANMRSNKIGESTIRCYLKHFKVALGWAEKKGMLNNAPEIELPKRARAKSRMKGKPISKSEFRKIIGSVKTVRPQDAGQWRRYLHGLWMSGLRIGESINLSWNEDSDISVDLTGRYPRFRIFAEGHKSRRDELLPMAPDFADWLLKTPENERSGLAFPLSMTANHASRIITRIARNAKVKATAHDFRRSFGTRWSKSVMPAILQKLMRHADIKTTMEFYVAHDADDIGDQLRGV